MTIPEILSFKFTPAQLSGFKKGDFDPSGTKFVAHSVLPLETQDLAHELSSLQSYGYDHSGNYEKTFTINNGDGTFSYKELSQLIEEGAFTWVAIRFFGILYEGDWYSKKEVTFYEKGDEVTIIEKLEWQYSTENIDWDQHYFVLVPPFQLEPDFGKISEMASRQLNEQLMLTADYEKVMAYYKTMPKGKIPTKQIPQYPQYREFIGIPWLVAFEKQENKERNNLHFQTYINQEVFIPFARRLVYHLPEDFNLIPFLQHNMPFPLIYPHSKEQVLVQIKVFNHVGSKVLYYFLYLSREKKIFQWTLPEQRIIPAVTSPINPDHALLSRWEMEFHSSEPTITKDDKSFWNEYVFKKKDGEYCYLKHIEIENSQKDIYTQW